MRIPLQWCYSLFHFFSFCIAIGHIVGIMALCRHTRQFAMRYDQNHIIIPRIFA